MRGQRRVLVVDDSKIIRQMLVGHLAEWGVHDIHEAEDGYEALSVLEERPFDLVLLDWAMPKMNGMQVMRLLRTREGMNRNVKVIMVTAEAHKENVVVALKEGVNDYVVKPFNTETLRAKVEQILAVQKPRIELA